NKTYIENKPACSNTCNNPSNAPITSAAKETSKNDNDSLESCGFVAKNLFTLFLDFVLNDSCKTVSMMISSFLYSTVTVALINWCPAPQYSLYKIKFSPGS